MEVKNVLNVNFFVGALDSNGNRMYYVNFSDLLSDFEKDLSYKEAYRLAHARANSLGGVKSSKKGYTEYFRFQSSSLRETAKHINKLRYEKE